MFNMCRVVALSRDICHAEFVPGSQDNEGEEGEYEGKQEAEHYIVLGSENESSRTAEMIIARVIDCKVMYAKIEVKWIGVNLRSNESH